ncbi:MAG: type 4a pilus biogenesis protein PilO [bacterium]
MAIGKEQQNLIAGVFIIIGGIFAFFYFVYMPLNKEVGEKVGKLKEVYSKIEELSSRVGQEELLVRKIEILRLELGESEKQLPSKEEVASLIRYLTEVSQSNGVIIKSFQPLKPDVKQYYTELVYGIELAGSYHSVAHFINTINQTERIISSRDLAIRDSSIKEGSGDTVACTLQVVTFMLQ